MYFSTLVLFISFKIILAHADTNYLINTQKCKMPAFPAFSKEANITYYPQNYTKCRDTDLLTYTTVKDNIPYLHINNEIGRFYDPELLCCYRYVTRYGTLDEPDVGISLSDCQHFNTTVRLKSNTIMVNCFQQGLLVYENVHNPITIRKPYTSRNKNGQKPISVLFIVIDSISRLNFIRTMPNTRNFLLKNGFFEFVGYNKIDDNTFPNFNALLTGLNLQQSYSKCLPRVVGGLDRCPMVWYDFRNNGYVTAYAEDWATISTYNYLKKGFQNPPTDYYFKPYIEAAETLNVTVKDTMLYCTGPETEGERILNLAKDFSVTFKDRPTFGIFWMNTFSHNYINSPSGMDDKVKEFFEDIERNGIFNESIVVLLSDHGIRFGGIRTTIQGFYEERLPMNLISIPPWFQRAYPNKYENFKRNSKRLTSTFDLYMTLQDVLKISVDNYNITPSLACPTCSSLFSEIPEDRSCSEAGIPELWCTCIGKFEQNDERINDITVKDINLALVEINNVETNLQYNLRVENIISSGISELSEKEGYYLIVFEPDVYIFYQAIFKLAFNPTRILYLIKMIRLY